MDDGYDTYVCVMSCVNIPGWTELVFKSKQVYKICHDGVV